MKATIFKVIITSLMVLIISSCNHNGGNEAEAENALSGEKSKLKINSVYRIKRDGTYVDLNTGKKISLIEDSLNKTIVDANTGFPVPFFIDIDTNDTIDQHGRIVNNALLPGKNGIWELDEGRLKQIK